MDTSAGIHRMFGFYKTCTIGTPSLCAGMPLITTQYALNTKRRETLKSVAHRAYRPYALCVEEEAVHRCGRPTRSPLVPATRQRHPAPGCRMQPPSVNLPKFFELSSSTGTTVHVPVVQNTAAFV
eukprot:COSAG02_NODE_2_length_75708_cov_87.013953_21_plen_125_part_00